MTTPIGMLIDLDRYPVDQIGQDSFGKMLDEVHGALADDGCVVLPGFIRRDALPTLVAEADSVAPNAHASHSRTNAYFTRDDPARDPSHPIRRFYDRSNAFIPADNFPADSPLRSIYAWPPFMEFIRMALGEREDRFFRYDDPLADVIINMVDAGNGFPWHFDTNNYTVTLAIQNAEEGGEFEYAPALRTSDDECFDAVREVLDGQSDRVKTLVLNPGDLQIFKGRYALHRVLPVSGTRRRYVGIFSFVEREGMCGSVERTRQLYGRVLPRHHERAGLRNDQLVD